MLLSIINYVIYYFKSLFFQPSFCTKWHFYHFFLFYIPPIFIIVIFHSSFEFRIYFRCFLLFYPIITAFFFTASIFKILDFQFIVFVYLIFCFCPFPQSLCVVSLFIPPTFNNLNFQFFVFEMYMYFLSLSSSALHSQPLVIPITIKILKFQATRNRIVLNKKKYEWLGLVALISTFLSRAVFMKYEAQRPTISIQLY